MKHFAKKSLVASMIAIVACFVMLLGTTFAWFTDSVSSGNNIIASGALDVNAYWMEGQLDPETDTWNTFESGAIFNYNKWEPGYTVARHIKVANEGCLAFRFKLQFMATGAVSELANVLDVYYFDGATQMNRDTLASATYVGTLAEVLGNSVGITAGAIMPEGATASANEFVGSATGTIVIKMRDEAGNEYQNMTLGSTFDITVLAAQYTAEEDSFGSNYDENADYFHIVNNAQDLTALLNAGKNVMLGSDLIDVPVTTTAPYGNKYGFALNGGILDGNGHTIDFDMPYGDHYGIMTSGGTIQNLTVSGVFRTIVVMSPTEDVVIDNCTIAGDKVCYGVNTAEGNGQHNVIIKNSTLCGWNSIGNTVKSVTFENCNFVQGEYYTNVYGRLVKPYVNAQFINCDFDSLYYLDLSALVAGNTVTLDGCSVNGAVITASNWTSMIAPENTCGAGQISIEGRNGTFMTATNVFDYVTIK